MQRIKNPHAVALGRKVRRSRGPNCVHCGAERVMYAGRLCCKACTSEKNRERGRRYYQSSEKARAYDWEKKRRAKYGLSRDQYLKLLAEQNNSCASCNCSFEHTEAYVDHCHRTGMVRGLLCRNCNIAEGLLKTVKNTRALLRYMETTELLYGTQS